jgi:outer membrane lipoprotein-sorting protein
MENLRQAGDKAVSALKTTAENGEGAAKNRAATLLGVIKNAPELSKIAAESKKIKSFEADLSSAVMMGGVPIQAMGHIKGVPEKKHFITDTSTQLGPMSMTQHMVFDGTTLWMEVSMPAPGNGTQKMVIKQAPEELNAKKSINSADLSAYLEEFDITAVHEETIGGVQLYILDGETREDYQEKIRKQLGNLGAMANQMQTQATAAKVCKIQIGKDDAFVRKVETKNDVGVAILTVELTNIKINPQLDDALFIYSPPPGVTVMDGADLKASLKKQGQAPSKTPDKAKDF